MTKSLLNDLSKHLKKNPPPMLWHYTSLKGFLGIVETKAVWATDSRYLNDTREYLHAFDLFRKAITSKLSSANEVDRIFLNLATQLFDTVHNLKENKVFVSSFSESRDQLGQWRAYGASGNGVCVGFNLQKLKHLEEGMFNSFLAPCIYSERSQAAIVESWLSHFLDLMRTLRQMRIDKNQDIPQMFLGDGTPNHDFVAYVGSELLSRLIEVTTVAGRLCALMKNNAFSEEKEWRLVVTVARSRRLPSQYEYLTRVGANSLVPYIKFSLDGGERAFQDRLKEVIIGPNPDGDRAIDAMSDFLANAGFKGTAPSRSQIPFRNW